MRRWYTSQTASTLTLSSGPLLTRLRTWPVPMPPQPMTPKWMRSLEPTGPSARRFAARPRPAVVRAVRLRKRLRLQESASPGTGQNDLFSDDDMFSGSPSLASWVDGAADQERSASRDPMTALTRPLLAPTGSFSPARLLYRLGTL